VGHRNKPGRSPSVRTRRRAACARSVCPPKCLISPQLPRIDRKALLLGTALASTLLIAAVAAPPPAQAAVTCPSGTGQISIPNAVNPTEAIICVNTDNRVYNGVNGGVIQLSRPSNNAFIYLNNSGTLTGTTINTAYGVRAYTIGINGSIDIVNTGDIQATSLNRFAAGFYAVTTLGNSPITITNSGNVRVSSPTTSDGIFAYTQDDNSAITITESAAITATGTAAAYGIYAKTNGNNSKISITNASHVTATSNGINATGINTYTYGDNSLTSINDKGDITANGLVCLRHLLPHAWFKQPDHHQ
jgi:autotransporter family porin